MKEYKFNKALPVWEQGKECEKNYNLVFRSVVGKCENSLICISASNVYQLFVNGKMIAHGPARAGHGYFRVDEIDLSEYLNKEENVVAIFVNQYYVQNYYLVRQDAFFCAEIIANGKVVAATGDKGFEAIYNSYRIRKVERYSGQRTFTEAYNYDNEYNQLLCEPEVALGIVKLSHMGEKKFLFREVPYPAYNRIKIKDRIKKGVVDFCDAINHENYRALKIDGEERGFFYEDLEISNSDEINKGAYKFFDENATGFSNDELTANTFGIYSLPNEKTGFIELDVSCNEDTTIMVAFDEILLDGDIDIHRSGAVNSVIWNLKKGNYTLISNEPYSFKYLKLINKSNNAVLSVNYAGIITYEFDLLTEKLGSSDEVLNKIYDAAIETFKQNTLDIYMDCPSRERAGWLCDSFFTARTEYALTGKSKVEKNFLENFIYNDGNIGLIKEMIPMCYPADFRTGIFIPQWAMWYVLELEEYFQRSGDNSLIEAAREKIFVLLDYFKKYENEDGLLENLDGWLFVEWSKAEEFTNGVNYPTNMLYAKMLDVISRLYNKKELYEKSLKIKDVIIKQSYFDGFFHDHAIRQEDGNLNTVAEEITETCQYYAFFMETASYENFPELWKTLVRDFGPEREKRGLWKHIYPSNAFIGYFLRLELLYRAKEIDKLLENVRGFFGYMAEKTGTLWEHKTSHASCNHGFASHIAVWLKELKNSACL